jgi:hypothetical protein
VLGEGVIGKAEVRLRLRVARTRMVWRSDTREIIFVGIGIEIEDEVVFGESKSECARWTTWNWSRCVLSFGDI